jgi:LacI family transcriptional regulator
VAVSIRDVARLAGVSVGTVSNTINRPQRVRPATRQVVERAIAELGFVPNQHARALSGVSSQVIGLIVPDVVSPFFMGVARAVERAAGEAGHLVILCNSENDSAKEASLLRLLAAQRVRGALVTPAGAAPPGDAADLPLVFLDHETTAADCSVSVDHVMGERLATRHLLDSGLGRLAFVGGPLRLRQMAQRAEGARAELRAAGLDPAESLVEIIMPGFGIQDGLGAAERLLAGGLPEGVLCGNDMLAFGVYRGLTRAGVRIPVDVALVGYDDIDFAADWIVPLTSVRQPTDELGYRAARLLLEHTGLLPEGGRHEHRQVTLQPDLIVRHSSERRRQRS